MVYFKYGRKYYVIDRNGEGDEFRSVEFTVVYNFI